MKKMLIGVLLLVVLFQVGTIQVSADVGPKATAEIEIIGVDVDYWFELLIPVRGSIEGQLPEYYEDTIRYDYYRDDYPERLLTFQDEDGYAACTFYNGPPCVLRQTDDHVFKMTYFNAPRVFKVAIVTEEGSLIVSEAVERRLFQSSFTYDLSGVDLSEDAFGVGELEENIPYRGIGLSFLVRVLVTVGLELMVLALFMYRRTSSYKLVAIVNLISQSLLTAGVLFGYYFGSIFGALGIFILGEIMVFTFEIVVYALKLREKGAARAVLYGLVANTVTVVVTFLFILIEPMLFS